LGRIQFIGIKFGCSSNHSLGNLRKNNLTKIEAQKLFGIRTHLIHNS